MLRFALALLLCVLAVGSARPQGALNEARKEGEVVWYTTQIIAQLVRPVSAAFESGTRS